MSGHVSGRPVLLAVAVLAGMVAATQAVVVPLFRHAVGK
jgi:hypothetical protein